jgi:hypothetical protein
MIQSISDAMLLVTPLHPHPPGYCCLVRSEDHKSQTDRQTDSRLDITVDVQQHHYIAARARSKLPYTQI